MSVDVLVRGAGVAGLTAAHELAAGGAAVTLVETGDAVGRGASWFAGGMLAPDCEAEMAEESVSRLGREALPWWRDRFPALTSQNGTLVVAPSRDSAELDRFAARTSGHVPLDAEGIAALEPDLAGRFRRALFFPEEGHLDPRAVMEELHRRLLAMGVRIAIGPAAAEEATGRDFQVTVDCTGIARAPHDAALRGVRGEMLYLRTGDVGLSRSIRLLHPRIPVYVVPRGDGRFMVGATMIESLADGPITARSTMELLNAAYALHPAFGEAEIVETGVGVRPAYPDNLPRAVWAGDEIVINGLYRHGFLLSPALARQAARMVFERSDLKETADESDRERQIS